MFACILVPTDFSAPAEAAVAFGRTMADQFDVRAAPCPVLTVHAGESAAITVVGERA